VTILEGRNRVGGRVNQVLLPNTKFSIDTGANWIHGTDHNPILDLAKQTGTATHSWGEKINDFDEDGKHILEKTAVEYNEIFWGIIADAFAHSHKNGPTISTQVSLYDFMEAKLLERFPAKDEKSELSRKTVLQIALMWGAFVGSTIKRQSLKYFWLEETIEGENLFCAGTYQKILERIAKPALEGAEIQFRTKATKIETDEEKQGKVVVTTQDEKRLEFDDVVVTAPLGWLKKNERAFNPPLPPRLSKAIGSIGYGCLEKVWISFPKAFWLSNPPNEQDSVGFTQFLSPKYSDLNPERWNQELVEFGSLPTDCAHPILLFYIFGDQSRAMTSVLAQTPSQEDRHKYLTEFFYSYYSRMPNFSDSDPDCIPTSSYATEWINDDLAGNGSYSNFQIGLEEGDKDIETMREGLPDRHLWFAGEHTAPFVASGTTTGAYWSGEAVARRIVEAHGMAVKEDNMANGAGPAPNGVPDEDKELNARAFADVPADK
jgi:hypothetical protein